MALKRCGLTLYCFHPSSKHSHSQTLCVGRKWGVCKSITKTMKSIQGQRSVFWLRFLAASGSYFGIRRSISRIKSAFSAHPLQTLSSPQAERIFLSSLTRSFFRSVAVKSICFSGKHSNNFNRFTTPLLTDLFPEEVSSTVL